MISYALKYLRFSLLKHAVVVEVSIPTTYYPAQSFENQVGESAWVGKRI
jgi:uncharacterized protein (UPF0333 family)